MEEFTQNIVSQRFVNMVESMLTSKAIVSYTELANLLDFPKQSISDIKNKKRDVTVELVRKFCTHFGVSADLLFLGTQNDDNDQVKRSGNRSGNYESGEEFPVLVKEAQESYHVKKALNQEFNKELELLKRAKDEYFTHNNIIYVPVGARAGFLEGYGQEKYENELPRFSLPGINRGIFYAFPVEGDSMFGTFTNGDIVITEPIAELKYIRPNEAYVMASHIEGIVLKRLEFNKLTGIVTATSDNTYFKPYEIEPTEIKSVFKVIRFMSANTGKRNALDEQMQELHAHIKAIESKLLLKGE